MKTVFQETSLYPNLIDLEMDLSPPCYVHPPLPPQVPQFRPEEHEGIPNLWPQPRKGAPPRELKEELGEPSMWWTRTAQKPPPPRSGHFLFGRGQPTLTGNQCNNTGPFPLVIYIIGKLKPLHSQKSLRASLTF